MSEHDGAQEMSICSMYRDGVSLSTLQTAFDRGAEEIIEILHRNGVVEMREGEDWEAFVQRVREDVKHGVAA